MGKESISIITYLGGPIDAAKDHGKKWRQKLKPILDDLYQFLLDRFPNLELNFLVQDPVEKTEQTFQKSIDEIHLDIAESRLFYEKDYAEIIVHKIVKEDIEMIEKIKEADIGFGIIFFAPDTPTSGTHCEMWEGAYHGDVPFFIVSPAGLFGVPDWIHSIAYQKGGRIFCNFPTLIEFLRLWLVEKIEQKLKEKSSR